MPDFPDITVPERERIEAIKPDGDGSVPLCTRLVEAHLGVYKARYPEFAPERASDNRLAGWRRHVTDPPIAGLSGCIYDLAFYAVVKMIPEVEGMPIYCGLYAEVPKSASAMDLAARLDELVALAGNGAGEPLGNLLMLHELAPFVALNPDVEYFLRRSLKREAWTDSAQWDVTPLLDALSAERIEALNKAVAERNLAFVLATTPACDSGG